MEVFQSIKILCLAWSPSPICPEISIGFMADVLITIREYEEGNIYLLEDTVKWPATILRSNESFEIHLRKETPRNWSNPLRTRPSKYRGDYIYPMYFDMKVKDNVLFAQDACLVTLEYCEKRYNYIGPGRHIHLWPTIQDRDNRHSFFTLPHIPMTMDGNVSVPDLSFESFQESETELKVITTLGMPGTVTFKLCNLPKEEIIKMTLPEGEFCISLFDKHEEIIIVAKYYGITAVISIIIEVLKFQREKRIKLLYIIAYDTHSKLLGDELNMLASHANQFTFKYLVETPPIKYSKLDAISGEFDETTFQAFTNSTKLSKTQYVIVSGERNFIFPAARLMSEKFGCYRKNIYRIMT